MSPEISDYALIGDCRTSALVSRDGSIDWLCLPHFSGASVFARLLDSERGGFCEISPSQPFTSSRRYVSGSAALETTFTVGDGIAVVRDAMILTDVSETMAPMRELLRVIELQSGQVEFNIVIDVRPDYGRISPSIKRRGCLGWAISWGNEILNVGTTASLVLESGRLIGRLRLEKGQRHYLSLSYTKGDPAIIPSVGKEADDRLDQTIRWWRGWIAQSTYRGPFREMVERSAITLKLLHYALSGAIVAAPTTSLPEAIGKVKNWDYRYCWLRDAGLTMQALVGLGYKKDARFFLDWLLHSTRLTWPKLQVMYDIYGRTNLTERELGHLRGYRDSRPVRVGNGAYAQLQIDTYGEIVMAADAFVEAGGTLDRQSQRLLIGLGRTVCTEWKKPDSGIWEPRGALQHYTHSKLMCWVALDRLIHLDDTGVISLGRLKHKFQQERQTIGAAIEGHGFNTAINSYTDVFDGHKLDASLLLMVCAHYSAGSRSRLAATHDRILSRLRAGEALLYRREPANPNEPTEGAFGICSFWSVENFSDRGQIDTADRLLSELAGLANDVGLFGEEFDPATGATLGNFPQAFTHVGFINAALATEQARKNVVRQ